MEFRQSRTYENLKKAMDGEMRASTRYRMYAGTAEEEKRRPIAKVFEVLAHNEKEHAEVWNRLINENQEVSTEENLKNASGNEQYEWMQMYEEYANIAAEEGYPQISDLFRRVALIEHHHDILLQRLLQDLKSNQIFCSEEEDMWICTNCGYVSYGICAPEGCPVCGYPQEYYEKLNEEDKK